MFHPLITKRHEVSAIFTFKHKTYHERKRIIINVRVKLARWEVRAECVSGLITSVSDSVQKGKHTYVYGTCMGANG